MTKLKIFVPILLGSLILGSYFWFKPQIADIQNITIYDRNGQILYENHLNRTVKLENVPISLQNAVTVTEDASYWTNIGIDVKAIGRAFIHNLTNPENIEGASTISQQIIKINAGTINDRSYINKIKEMGSAIWLNALYPKKTILENYLNTVYMGNQLYGIQTAANLYLNKDITGLSLAESTLLTAIISSPDKFNPLTNFTAAKTRQEYILARMLSKKVISQEEYVNAIKEQLNISHPQIQTNAPHFTNKILEELKDYNLPYQNGLKIYTTLDLNKYKKALEIARFWVSSLKEKHNLTNASLVLIDNKTGQIEVMLGGIDYFDEKNGGQINMATALRQPGSSIKPITYATAFSLGITAGTPLNDVQTAFSTKTGEGYTPRNYDNMFHGTVLAREALASSLNVPAVEVLNRIGISNFLEVAKKLGLTTFDNANLDLAVTLGGGEITLVELANAYASFAREGRFIPTYDITAISDQNGKVLYKHTNSAEYDVFGTKSKQVAYLISDILADPKARMLGFGEKNPLVLSHTAAVKTGTTTDWHDVWTVGYTPDKTVGVWAGNNNNSPMKAISGVTGAAPIWNQFFEELLKGQENHIFTRPQGIITKWICKDPTILDLNSCINKYEEKFISGTENGIAINNNLTTNIIYPLNNAVFNIDTSLSSAAVVTFKVNNYTICKLDEKAITIINNQYAWAPEKGLHTLICGNESITFSVE